MIRYFTYFSILLIISCGKTKQSETTPNWGTKYSLNTPSYFGDYLLPTDNPLTNEGIALGRKLFYDPILSSNNTVSCASCHIQARAFSDSNTFSSGTTGQKGTRNSMAIHNTLWQSKFFWDGRASSLEEQALMPIVNPLEMNQSLEETIAKLHADSEYPDLFKKAFGSETITSKNLAKAISQFERTLISSNSKFDKFLRGETTLTESEMNGKTLFFTHPLANEGLRGGNCGDCHGGNLAGTGSFHNNGLDSIFTDKGLGAVTNNVLDNGVFKAPSLRNIGFSAPYMHDGRFKTLREVLDHYNGHMAQSITLDPLMYISNEVNGTTLKLTEDEKTDIINFLNTLNDTNFVTNPDFSKPK